MEFITSEEIIRNQLKNKVNSLFIDFDDTLVDYPSCQDQALEKLLLLHDLEISDYPNVFKLYHDINGQLWPLLESGEKTIPQIREERFKILKQSVPLDDDPIELDKKYLEYFVLSTSISEPNFHNLQKLRDQEYNIIITTNGIRDVQQKRISHIGIDSLVDEVITSEDVGQAKPAPLMFEIAMKKYSLERDQVFLIGDSLSSDIKGANNAKITSCWLNYGKDYAIQKTLAKPDLISYNFVSISEFLLQLETE